jgi:hypothetical protein
VPDSIAFLREEAAITVRGDSFSDVPWFQDVAALIGRHFQPELFTTMTSDGIWQLGVTAVLSKDE